MSIALIALVVTMVALVLIRVPLAFSLLGSATVYFLIAGPGKLYVIPKQVWSGTNSFVLIAMPLFILAGELMNHGGITKRIIDFSLLLVRPIRGGLGEVNVVASMIFGGISGSSVADTSAIGSILIPNMEKQGYSKGFSAGVTVASSTMGMIIPPSVPMLMYAMVSGASVGKLFLAGVVPGLMIGLSQLSLVWYISKKNNFHPPVRKFDRKEAVDTTRDGLFAIIMPAVIVICVSFGIATASESASIACLYALIIGCFFYKELKLKEIISSIKKSFMMCASIMFIVGSCKVITWVLNIERVSSEIQGFFNGLEINYIWVLLLIDLLILLIGTFVDVVPTLLLLCPILLPVVGKFGVDPLQLGAIMIVGTAVGLVTPPIGMCLNAANKISGMPILKIFKEAAPFIVCNVVILVIVTLIPAVSTWLPNLVFNLTK